MRRTITLVKDDGTIVKTTTEELQTENNWNRKYYKLRRNAVGEILTWRGSREDHMFYTEAEVRPMTERDRDKYLQKQKKQRQEQRKKKKEKESREKKKEEKRILAKYGVLLKDGRKIVLDTETTGLNSTEDEILQLAIIDGAGDVLINEVFRPEKKTEWSEAEAVHGISPADVSEAPTFTVHKERIQQIINDSDIMVVYNAEFDLKMLRKQGITISADTTIIDTMVLFAEIYGDWNGYYNNYRWQKLDTCAEYYGYDWGDDEAHDALSDCRATLYCTDCMRKEMMPKLIRLPE